MKTQWTVDAPFVFVDPENLEGNGKSIYEAFKSYVEALIRVVTD